jgi:F plasmid transfer operon, TraF, protein
MTTINACGGIMNSKKLLLGALIASAATSAQAVPYGFYDARSVGMGNVSVATGGLAVAGLSNPAMLIMNENKDSFALLLPAVGAQLIDNGGLLDKADQLQILSDQFTANPNQTTYDEMAALLQSMNNTSLSVNGDVNLALAYAGDNWAFAGTFRGYVGAGAGVFNVVAPPYVNTSTPEPTASFQGVGVLVTETGFSVATKFDVMGMNLAVGVTPKNVSVESSITNVITVNALDTNDPVTDTTEETLGSFTTVDAGVALQVTDSISVGLVAKNLLSESFASTINDPAGNPYQINFDTHMRAGAAYHNSFMTLAADMDLTEIDPISFEDPSKMLALGLELNAFDFLQLRAGYQTNMASGSTEPNLLSAGIGLWLGFHLDAAVVVGSDSSIGAMAQLGFSF